VKRVVTNLIEGAIASASCSPLQMTEAATINTDRMW
jgi:hypothetical protein